MTGDSQTILTVNAGSSSIKLDAFTSNAATKLLSISLENIGQPRQRLSIIRADNSKVSRDLDLIDQAAIHAELFAALDDELHAPILAIGHRVVHGGLRTKSVVIDDALMPELEQFAQFDPEHMPAALTLIRACLERYYDAVYVACFDTAFFANLPEVAQTLPLPAKYANLGLKRYGFHGLSYRYLVERLTTLAVDPKPSKVIYAHLGSGASLAAVKDGLPIDTTMSFTPASGIVMSTRSGDLDPGIALFLQKQAGLDLESFTHLVNHESGLLGISGMTAEMKTLIEASRTNHLAALAVELFCYRVRLAVGSLTAALGGVDAIVFSGGIGERSVPVRAMICQELGYLGVELDDAKNAASQNLISTSTSRVQVYVVPTDESQTIAAEVIAILDANKQIEG